MKVCLVLLVGVLTFAASRVFVRIEIDKIRADRGLIQLPVVRNSSGRLVRWLDIKPHLQQEKEELDSLRQELALLEKEGRR